MRKTAALWENTDTYEENEDVKNADQAEHEKSELSSRTPHEIHIRLWVYAAERLLVSAAGFLWFRAVLLRRIHFNICPHTKPLPQEDQQLGPLQRSTK